LTLAQRPGQGINSPLHKADFLIEKVSLTGRSFEVLKLLLKNGKRETVYSFHTRQSDLARKLQLTRQALSIHLKRLRESGFVQVGRGFVNITEDGLKAIGYHSSPVIIIVRVSPQRRLEAIGRMKSLSAVEIFRVTGDVDVVLIAEQGRLDNVLETLSKIDGVIEIKSLVSIEGSSFG